MKDTFMVVSGCLLLVLVVHIEFSKAQDEIVKKEKEREEIWKKSYEDTMKTYEQFKADKSKTLLKLGYLAQNPRPIPNILEIINKNDDVKSLQVAFEEIWPEFWKVPRRKQCAKLFDQKAENLTLEVTEETKNNYNKMISYLIHPILKYDEDLNNEIKTKETDYHNLLKNCIKLDLFCKIRSKNLEFGIEHVNYAEKYVEGLYDTIKRSVTDILHQRIRTSLIDPVKACLNQ